MKHAAAHCQSHYVQHKSRGNMSILFAYNPVLTIAYGTESPDLWKHVCLELVVHQ